MYGFGKLPWAVIDLFARHGGGFSWWKSIVTGVWVRCGDFGRSAGSACIFDRPLAGRPGYLALRP